MWINSPMQQPTIRYIERPALKYNPLYEVQSYQSGQLAMQQTDAQLEPGEVPETTTYGCELCTTCTYFNNFGNLCCHVTRFHSGFHNGERGVKRGVV